MKWAGLLFALITSHAFAQSTSLDLTDAEVEALSINAGLQAQYGPCLCLRSTLLLKTFDGQWVTKHAVIRSDALFSFQSRRNPYTREIIGQMLHAGAFEALSRERPIGLGFRGIEWSRNLDFSLRNHLRSGIYALFSLVRSQFIQMDFETGVDWRREIFNLRSEVEAAEIPLALQFEIESRHIGFSFQALIGFSSLFDFAPRDAHIELNMGTEVHALIEDNTQLNFGIEGRFERDPVWALFGIPPNAALAEAYLGIEWEVRE